MTEGQTESRTYNAPTHKSTASPALVLSVYNRVSYQLHTGAERSSNAVYYPGQHTSQELGEWLTADIGTRQGDPISPLESIARLNKSNGRS